MADQPIDCTESMFRAERCVSCRTNVVAVVDYDGEPMCLECRRIAEGIDWESQDLIGEWHPAVGYPRPIQWASADKASQDPVSDGLRWACINCFDGGPADTPNHAAHLIRMHDTFACPALPTPPAEHALRVARRADMTRRYPEQTPAWIDPPNHA